MSASSSLSVVITNPKVVIYISPLCPYCQRAMSLLRMKGVPFEEIDVIAEPARRPEMVERAEGRRTVPQIFIDDRGIGGCDDLHALDASGELDRLLGRLESPEAGPAA